MDGGKMFETSRVICSNLDSIAKEQGRLHEMALCELSLAAATIASSVSEGIAAGMSLNELMTVLSEETVLLPADPSNDTPDFTVESVRKFMAQQNGIDKAAFALQLSSRLSEAGISVTESEYLDTEEQPETVAYVRNALSDEAFDVFSQEFSDPRVIYAQSFREACAAVADRKAGYCILPYEERGGARIPTISALVSSYDLKIIAITPVFGFEGNADMKYALIGRSFVIPECDDLTDRYLELSVSCNSNVSLGELLSAAEYMSLSVFGVYTDVSSSMGSESYFTLILKDGGSTFAPFLTYLCLFVGEFEPMGLYKNIE